jgi:hypothetical protein
VRRAAPAMIAAVAVVLVLAGAFAAAPQQAGCTGVGCSYLAVIVKPEDPTATATASPEPSPTKKPSATPTERPIIPLANGDFEQGALHWKGNTGFITNALPRG